MSARVSGLLMVKRKTGYRKKMSEKNTEKLNTYVYRRRYKKEAVKRNTKLTAIVRCITGKVKRQWTAQWNALRLLKPFGFRTGREKKSIEVKKDGLNFICKLRSNHNILLYSKIFSVVFFLLCLDWVLCQNMFLF